MPERHRPSDVTAAVGDTPIGTPLASEPGVFYRFALGGAEFTIVNDGYVVSGEPRFTHPRPDPNEVNALLTRHHLPTDRLILEGNVLIARLAGTVVMFDTGLGRPSVVPSWGLHAGKLGENLRRSGIDPTEVESIVLSHGHAEHIGGITMHDDAPFFPNARIFISRAEYDYWTSADLTGTRWAFEHERALRCLAKNRHRITFIQAGEEFLPGITAIGAPGHTVDHMVFKISAGDALLCYIADLARHHVLNVQAPTWEFIGDADGALTVESRLRVFAMVAGRDMPIVSYHYPWPGLGYIVRRGEQYHYQSGSTNAVHDAP